MMNDYRIHYLEMIEFAKSQQRCKTQGYFENHHIIPESLGGSDESYNMVLLTSEEHLKVHTLLPYFTKEGDRESMVYAWNMMSNRNGKPINYKEYSFLRESHSSIVSKRMLGTKNPKHSERMKGKGNPNYGKGLFGKDNPMYGLTGLNHPLFGSKWSEKQKEGISGKNHWSFGKDMSKYHNENFTFSGCKHSEDSKQKMSKSSSGIIMSEKTKIKISESNKGKTHSNRSKRKMSEVWTNRELIYCPHCNKTSISAAMMKRWHFTNCKLNDSFWEEW